MNIKNSAITVLIASSFGSSAAFVSNGAARMQTKLFVEDGGNVEPALGDRRNLFKAAGALATANALLPNIASAETPTTLQAASSLKSSLKLPKMGLVSTCNSMLDFNHLQIN